MSRLIAKEGGRFPFDFGQLYQGLFPDELGVGAVAQGLLVAAERQRTVKTPAGTPPKPRLEQKRQSRITVALDGTDPRFAYRPAKPNDPDVGFRFGRENAANSLTGRSLDSRPTLATARRRQTTIPLSGQPPLEPTHRLINLKVPFETVAVALAAGPSEFKLATLTNAGGGLGFDESRNYYLDLAAGRKQSEAESTPLADLNPEIPWIK